MSDEDDLRRIREALMLPSEFDGFYEKLRKVEQEIAAKKQESDALRAIMRVNTTGYVFTVKGSATGSAVRIFQRDDDIDDRMRLELASLTLQDCVDLRDFLLQWFPKETPK